MTINIDSFKRQMGRLGSWEVTNDDTCVFALSGERLVAIDTDNRRLEVFIGGTGIMKSYDPELIASEIVDLIEETFYDVEGISR